MGTNKNYISVFDLRHLSYIIIFEIIGKIIGYKTATSSSAQHLAVSSDVFSLFAIYAWQHLVLWFVLTLITKIPASQISFWKIFKFQQSCGPHIFLRFVVMVDPLKIFWVLTNSTYLGKFKCNVNKCIYFRRKKLYLIYKCANILII